MKTSACALRRVNKVEISFKKINEIIVVGDPGCTKFDDHSKRILGEILAKKADAFIVLGDMVFQGRDDELKEFTSFCNAATRTPVFTRGPRTGSARWPASI